MVRRGGGNHVNTRRLLLIRFELANPSLEPVNSLEQHLERLLVHIHDISRLLCVQIGRNKSEPTGEEEQQVWPASGEEPPRASMIGRSKEVHSFLLQDQNAPAPSACERQSTMPRSPRDAERLWRVSFVDSLAVDELVEPNPVPPGKRTATKSSRKPYLRTKLQHLRGRFNWVAAMGSP